jgi:hypothetical protein
MASHAPFTQPSIADAAANLLTTGIFTTNAQVDSFSEQRATPPRRREMRTGEEAAQCGEADSLFAAPLLPCVSATTSTAATIT